MHREHRKAYIVKTLVFGPVRESGLQLVSAALGTAPGLAVLRAHPGAVRRGAQSGGEVLLGAVRFVAGRPWLSV